MQEWQRVQECIPPLTGTETEHKEAWAKAANLTVSELNRIEGDAFLAAHLMLASVESLLRGICWKYVYRVRPLLVDHHCLSITDTGRCKRIQDLGA